MISITGPIEIKMSMKRFNFDIKIVKEAIGGDALSKRPKFFHMRNYWKEKKP